MTTFLSFLDCVVEFLLRVVIYRIFDKLLLPFQTIFLTSFFLFIFNCVDLCLLIFSWFYFNFVFFYWLRPFFFFWCSIVLYKTLKFKIKAFMSFYFYKYTFLFHQFFFSLFLLLHFCLFGQTCLVLHFVSLFLF